MKELEIYLGALRRQGIFETWHDQQIQPGNDWLQEMEQHLMMAQIIVLLISPHFLNSDYCYDVQIAKAVERHKQAEVCLIPVILRDVYYGRTPFAHIQPLPTGGKPVRSRRHWRNRDEAFFDVSEGIRKVAEKL